MQNEESDLSTADSSISLQISNQGKEERRDGEKQDNGPAAREINSRNMRLSISTSIFFSMGAD